MAAAASDSSSGKCKSICGKLGLKPLTKANVIGFYIPAQGLISYTALSVNVINPKLCSRAFTGKDIINTLLAHTVIGAGVYLYGRAHMQNVDTKKRVLFSAFGAVVFTLGSVLIWSIIRESNFVRSPISGVTLALLSSIGLSSIGIGYVNQIDRTASSGGN